MIINVIGAGYVGLPTALVMATPNQKVILTDIDENKINELRNNTYTLNEPGYNKIYEEAVNNGLDFTTDYVNADVYIVAVPTPYIKDSKKVDTKYILDAIDSINDVCGKECIVVIESTIPPKTIDGLIKPYIESKYKNKKFNLAHAPERILPGKTFEELTLNPRVIGVDSKEVGDILKTIYAEFCSGTIVITDIVSAEMSKVVENTYRDINIAYANELVKICNEGNMNVYDIIEIANMHPRVNILNPGPGVGGHCISVDPWFLVGEYPGLTNMILTARNLNDSMPEYVLGRIIEIMKEHNLSDMKRVGLYGLTYKEDIDDCRESPTLQLIDNVCNHLGEEPITFDPMVKDRILDNQKFDFEEFVKELDIVVVMVGHKHILNNLSALSGKIILDTKNMIESSELFKRYSL